MPLKVLFWSCFSASGSKWIDARAEVYYKPTLFVTVLGQQHYYIFCLSVIDLSFLNYYTDKLALLPRLSLNFWAQVILLLHPLRKNVFLTFGQGVLFLSQCYSHHHSQVACDFGASVWSRYFWLAFSIWYGSILKEKTFSNSYILSVLLCRYLKTDRWRWVRYLRQGSRILQECGQIFQNILSWPALSKENSH